MSVVKPEMVVPAFTTPETEEARWRSHAAGLANQLTEAEVELVESVALALFRPAMDLFVRLLRIWAVVVAA
jgi:hypothetical protein